MSSSFKRKTESTPQTLPNGIKQSPALSTVFLTSSGIPSLDDVLGGGIQLGTSFLVLNPDPHSAHTDLLQKYFIAQGLASNQTVHVFDADARNLAKSCMWIPGATATSVTEDAEDGLEAKDGKVKIAWRYEHMQKFKTTVSTQGSDQEDFCRPFDLSQSIPPDTIESFLAVGLLRIEDSYLEDATDVYDRVIQRIEDIVKSCDNSNSTTKQVTRISIPAFTSPIWGDPNPTKVLHFLIRLRALLRSADLVCAFITASAHISSDAWAGEGWTEKLAWVSDACIGLNSFSADPATSALFPSHHGLLKIYRLPCVQTLVPASDRFSNLRGLSAPTSSISSGGIGENNLAFKCTRKRFVIETFHLDIDGGVSERRTTPAVSSIAIQEGDTGKVSSCDHSHHDPGREPRVLIEREIRARIGGESEIPKLPEEISQIQKSDIKKKAKKRVGFQVDRPDIFDF
ncbi:ELP4 [Sanghuangporus weigelae]